MMTLFGFLVWNVGIVKKKSRTTIKAHLYVNEINESYKFWFWHGEQLLNSSLNGKSSN